MTNFKKIKPVGIACTLTTPELQKRKQTVIESLKHQLLEKKALKKGYAFKFPGTDEIIDELIAFIKSERICCNFFTFAIDVNGYNEIWLKLRGNEDVKDFIISELGF